MKKITHFPPEYLNANKGNGGKTADAVLGKCEIVPQAARYPVSSRNEQTPDLKDTPSLAFRNYISKKSNAS